MYQLIIDNPVTLSFLITLASFAVTLWGLSRISRNLVPTYREHDNDNLPVHRVRRVLRVRDRS